MKILLAVLVVIMVLASIVSARPGAISYGPKFALNFATEGGDNSSYISSSTKFGIGGFLTYSLEDQFALQGELLYNRKGCSTTNNVTYTGSYLDFVALAKYNIPVVGNIKPSAFAGPSIGFLLSASASNSTESQDITSSVSGVDFGLVFGAGAMYTMGHQGIVFDLRYYLGFTNVNKTSPPSNTNQVFSINVGYAFM